MDNRQTTEALVTAARDGDPDAVDRLVAGYLPLVYNVVGRAMDGHADVDDVVQETMLRCLSGLSDLRSPASFRPWLLSIALRQVRTRYRFRQAGPAALPDDVADPGADFADLTVLRLHLSGQRREVAEATRWLDEDNRELLALWWLEAAGTLSRDEVAGALGLTLPHTAVRIQRMKARLEAARAVVRALLAVPRCPALAALITGWSGRPEPLWRKRLARHTRECLRCETGWADLLAPERLLAGMSLVPLPVALGAWWASLTGHGAGLTSTTPGNATPGNATPGNATPRDVTPGGTEVTGRRSPHRMAAGRRRPAGRFGRTPVVVSVVAALTVCAALTGYALRPGPPLTTAQAGAPEAAVPSAAASTTATPTPNPTPSGTAKPTPTPSRSRRVAPPPARDSAKKGVATWEFSQVTAGLREIRAGWYYNWSPTNASMPAPSGVEFVPMIWGADSVTDANLATAKRQGDVLLGFNEPDLGEQSNMTVERALDLWPRLQSTGLPLGSPAPAWGAADAGGWLDRFITGARQRGYRVDFIALHWYGSDFSAAAVGHLRSYLQATYRRYHLPIWLTEFALINFSGGQKYPTDAQQSAFVSGATRMLEGLSYVRRYAWFGLPSTADSGTGLYRADKTLTAAGRAYRTAG